MSRKAMPMTGLPQDFALTEKTVAWVSEKYPSVDISGTLERFIESAQAHGRMYADWQAAFKTWVRKAFDNKWDGVEYKKGRAADPKWIPILNEVRPFGFRAPLQHETPSIYRTEFNTWKGNLPESRNGRAPVIEFGDMMKMR